MSLEAPFADFCALAKCSQDSVTAKLSCNSALPPLVKHLTVSKLNCWLTEKKRNFSDSLDAGGCDDINF